MRDKLNLRQYDHFLDDVMISSASAIEIGHKQDPKKPISELVQTTFDFYKQTIECDFEERKITGSGAALYKKRLDKYLQLAEQYFAQAGQELQDAISRGQKAPLFPFGPDQRA